MSVSSQSGGGSRKNAQFLNTAQAADYVSLSKNTLEKMRVSGGGPIYRKHGRYVRYHINDLDAWSAANARGSTSDGDGKDVKRDPEDEDDELE